MESFSRKAWQAASSSRNQPAAAQIRWDTASAPRMAKAGLGGFRRAQLLATQGSQLVGQSARSKPFCLVSQVLRGKAQQVGRKRLNRAGFHSAISKFLAAISPAPGAVA